MTLRNLLLTAAAFACLATSARADWYRGDGDGEWRHRWHRDWDRPGWGYHPYVRYGDGYRGYPPPVVIAPPRPYGFLPPPPTFLPPPAFLPPPPIRYGY